jgi:Ca2+-binding EF-hand superfamily protein
MRMINKDVSPEDVDLIFLIFDDTNRGVLSKNEFHEIMKRLTPGARK